MLLFLVVPWSAGRLLRERAVGEHSERERAERIDAERERQAVAAAAHERTRIARELHDVITHSVSVMVIQAGAARSVMGADPARAESALSSAERAGSEALAEMRRLLGLLGDAEDGRKLKPQPGLADLEVLLAEVRAVGLAAELSVEGQPARIAPALELCAYRIVQEALTNAIKHARAKHASVRLRWTDGSLELDVDDDGRGPSDGEPTGHGLAGMRERAALHGGSVHLGRADGGGFRVRALLPLAVGDS
jgi:signal transduction histidine kinase